MAQHMAVLLARVYSALLRLQHHLLVLALVMAVVSDVLYLAILPDLNNQALEIR